MSEDQLFAHLSRIEANIADMREATKADLAELRTELREEMAGLAKNVDITALGRLIEQQRDDIASLKDDMTVLTAIVSRLDNSHTRLLTEIRATHAQVSRVTDRLGRFDDRVRHLEEERHP